VRIRFTRHARFKISLINEHGFLITTNHVKDAIEQPEFVTAEKSGRKGAVPVAGQGACDRGHIRRAQRYFSAVTVIVVRRVRYER